MRLWTKSLILVMTFGISGIILGNYFGNEGIFSIGILIISIGLVGIVPASYYHEKSKSTQKDRPLSRKKTPLFKEFWFILFLMVVTFGLIGAIISFLIGNGDLLGKIFLYTGIGLGIVGGGYSQKKMKEKKK
jgi:amino acid permease